MAPMYSHHIKLPYILSYDCYYASWTLQYIAYILTKNERLAESARLLVNYC